jgi:hypothetical protein
VVTGYDDATGWGSFNGANLLSDFAKYGKVAPYTPQAIAVGPDGTTYILWNGSGNDGNASVMSINTVGAIVGAPTFAAGYGWNATSLAIGSDNVVRILWVHSGDNATCWWTVSGDIQTVHPTLPMPGFVPQTISATANGGSVIVLSNPVNTVYPTANNGVLVWSITGDTHSEVPSYTSSPISNPAVITGAADSNGNIYIVWAQAASSAGGLVAIYTLSPSGAQIAAPVPTAMLPGWSMKSVSVGPDNVVRMLLTNSSGQFIEWADSLSGVLWKSSPYSGATDWTACGITGGLNGSNCILGEDTSAIWADVLVDSDNLMPTPLSLPSYYGY